MPSLSSLPLRRRCVALIVMFALLGIVSAAQTAKPAPRKTTPPNAKPKPDAARAENPFTAILGSPELLTAWGHLYEKLESGVHFPPARHDSRLLHLAPASTVFYAALPNYGDAAQQALSIFHAEVERDPVLRQWWQREVMGDVGPKLEDALEKFHAITQYLGDEIVITGTVEKAAPSVVLVAPVAKTGLKPALQQVLTEAAAGSRTRPNVRILDPRELAAAPDQVGDLLVLVRPDYLVATSDLETLRRFSASLDGGTGDFASTAFGQRVARAYQDGVTVVGAADLQTILNQGLSGKKDELAMAQRTGFADVQYLVWEHTNIAGRDVSQTELTFAGPRHGMAAWLGAPSPMGGLDFASPNALTVWSLNLTDPARMFDDLREMATAANPRAFEGVAQMERELKISLQQDLLRQLSGELTAEIDAVTPTPAWRLILRVNDPAHLQQTLDTLQTAQHVTSRRVQDSGATFTVVGVPSGKTPSEVAYAFVDGYLVVGSTLDVAKEAVRIHRAGESLAKSRKFLTALPPGHESGMSAIFYQNPAVAALQMQRVTGVSAAPAQPPANFPAAIMTAYATDTAIRGVSTSTTMDAGVVLVAAAVAIPNLLRSRVAANEASAVGSLRTLNTAQVVYASTYPERRFAPDLATLASGPGSSVPSSDHAGLIANTLGCGTGWCEKSGYRFRMTAVCIQEQCAQYVALATPVSTNTGARNFCSTSDGVIRWNVGRPMTAPIRAAECKTWQPLR